MAANIREENVFKRTLLRRLTSVVMIRKHGSYSSKQVKP